MARITGFIGDVTGKMGNMVAYTRRGVNFARQWQPNVTNPNTARQQRSRLIFSVAQGLSASLAPSVLMGYSAVSPTYERQSFVGKSIQSGAISVNDVSGSIDIDWGSVPVSWGPLVAPRTPLRPDVETPGSVRFPASSDTIADANLYIDGVTPINCLLFACIYAPSLNESILGLIGYRSEDGSYVAVNDSRVNYPASFSGEEAHIWAFCKQSPSPLNGISISTLPPRIRFRASDAVYLGASTLA